MESLQANGWCDHEDLSRPASSCPDDLHWKWFERRHDFVDACTHVVESLARDEVLAQCDVRVMGGVESEPATPGVGKSMVQTLSYASSLDREQDSDVESEKHHQRYRISRQLYG